MGGSRKEGLRADSAGFDDPLVVHFERDLVRCDLAMESALASFRSDPLRVVQAALLHRRAWREHLGEAPAIDVVALPYDDEALRHIAEAVGSGRRVILQTSDLAGPARQAATHLGLSDQVQVAKDQNDRQASRSSPWPQWSVLKRVLRIHQWAKNLLLFVPMFTAHRFNASTFVIVLLGAAAFSLCASAVYILNDLIDLESDRRHPTKRARPFASGECSVRDGLKLVPILLAWSAILALWVSYAFAGALLAYFVLTSAYSLKLKSKLLVDVVVLAMLYTGRILAGAIAAGVAVSHWLLAFSIFIFTALALMKRYVELSTLAANNLPDPRNRNYRASDLPIVSALAAASAVNAVTIFALYVSAGTEAAYSRPWALWLICPILLYWLSRALVLAHRRSMDDDPVLFALHDRVSRIALLCTAALVLIAI